MAIRVTARSISNLSMTSTVATLTICNPVRGIVLSADPAQRSVRPGREASFNITLNSTGNLLQEPGLRLTRVPAGWDGRLSSARLSLDMNATGTVQLLVVVPRNAQPGRTTLSVIADDSTGAAGNVSVVVEVLDRPGGEILSLDEGCFTVAALVLALAAAGVAAVEWRIRKRRSA
jgi:uncharacterized membrane protein